MSSYINKSDFLAALAGIPVDYTIEGVGTVKVRGLSILESNELNRKHNGDGAAIMCEAITLCVVEPQLDASDVAAIQSGQQRFVLDLGHKIQLLSGMVFDEEIEKKAGNGS